MSAPNPTCPGCLSLLARLEQLEARIVALEERNRQLEERNRELEARLNQNSSNSSRPPSSDPPALRKRPPKCKPSGRKQGGQPGHPGSFRAVVPLDQVDEVLDVLPPTCACCHAPLHGASERGPDPIRHQVTELPPLVARTTEYRLHGRACDRCGHVTRAALPEGVPTRAVGPRLQALCALLTGRYRVSRRGVQELLADVCGVRLSLGAISSLEQETAAALAAAYRQAAEHVAAAPVVGGDETGWRARGQSAWLWVGVTPEAALFRIDERRSRAALERLLPPDPERILISDRWSAYAHLPAERRQLCWPHLQREFQAIVDAAGPGAWIGERALAEVRRLFHEWHRYRDGEIERAALRRNLRPVQMRFAQLLRFGTASRCAKTARLARQLQKHWPSLWTFLYHEGVEPTNNAAERALRSAVLWRKNSFGHQGEGGKAFAERLLTVATTLRLQGRNVLEFLEAACRAAAGRGPAPALVTG